MADETHILTYSDKNAREVTFDELPHIQPLEEKTATYTPLPHYDFAQNVARLGVEMLGPHGFELNGSRIVVNKDAGRMFMVQAFNHNERSDLKLAVAGRNSTDKSCLAAVAIGAQVTACLNLCIGGKIRVVRKHTGDIFSYLNDNLVLAFHKATDGWNDMQADVEAMKKSTLDDREACRLIGQFWHSGLLMPQQMTAVRKRWENPPQNEFKDRTLWSLYNGVTDVYKQLPPTTIMQKHLKLHAHMREEILYPEKQNEREELLLAGDHDVDTHERAE
mgnify:CR=1 FL=1